MTELIRHYTNILQAAGLVAKEDGSVLKSDERYFVKGKPLMLPLPEVLRRGDVGEKLIFHPFAEAAAKGESVGRPHIAEVLLRKGFAKDVRQVFKEFLGSRGRAYLPKTVLEPEECVSLLASSGATVSLAHPLLWKAPAGWLDTMVARLKDYGLSAIEAYHSEHSEADIRTCLALAKRFDLGVSGGSDYHGANKPTIRLGQGYGGLRVSLSVFEGLKQRRIAAGLDA